MTNNAKKHSAITKTIDEIAFDGETDTKDAFHRGRFYVAQPKHGGHRAGFDAMIIASCVPPDCQGAVADLGSGAGAAGLAVAARCPEVRVTLVEKSSLMNAYALKTLNLAENYWLKNRVSVLNCDVTLAGRKRQQAGLADRYYDYVIMNPPFNGTDCQMTPHKVRAEAHVMEDQMFNKWLKTVAAILKPKGQFALIARPQSLMEILSGCSGRFGALNLIFVRPRRDADANRVIITGRLGSRAPLTVKASLIVHEEEGRNFCSTTDQLINGERHMAIND